MLPVGGTVYDTDGTTKLVNATVILQNTRTLDKSTTVTDSVDGTYSFDIDDTAVFPNGYEIGDTLLFYGRYIISTMAEKFAEDTQVVSGNPMTQNLTTVLYIKKDMHPLAGIDRHDSEMMIFDSHTRAQRVINVDTDGIRYINFAKKDGNNWKLVLPDGTQFGSVTTNADGKQDIKTTGEFSALQTF